MLSSSYHPIAFSQALSKTCLELREIHFENRWSGLFWKQRNGVLERVGWFVQGEWQSGLRSMYLTPRQCSIHYSPPPAPPNTIKKIRLLGWEATSLSPSFSLYLQAERDRWEYGLGHYPSGYVVVNKCVLCRFINPLLGTENEYFRCLMWYPRCSGNQVPLERMFCNLSKWSVMEAPGLA